MHQRAGFTFLELILSVAIVAILMSATIFLVNPPRLYAKARNAERTADLGALLSAIGENVADNRGAFNCAAGSLPTTSTRLASSGYNIAPCLVPGYLPDMPYDPNAPGAHWSSEADYDTGYFLLRNASSGRITISAPSAELGEVISMTR